MADMQDFLQEYDDLVSSVLDATHQFYASSLARWFALIDDTSPSSKIVSSLEALSDFDAWYDDLQLRRQSSGMGGSPLNLPDDKNAALGTLLTLFRRMSIDSISAFQFAHGYVPSGSRNVNDDLRHMSQQLFQPMTRDLRRRLAQLSDENVVEITFNIPASDRTVKIDHNAADYARAIEDLDKLEELIRTTNDYPESENRDQQIAELSASKRVLSANKIRIDVAISLIYKSLKYLAKKFSDIAIGKIATGVLALIGKITGLW
jgi:hypothetical protein